MIKGIKDVFPAAGGPEASPATLFLRGLEQMTELQKKAIELATEQNAQAVDACKRAFAGTPGLFLVDLAGQTFARCAQAQTRMADLVAEQTAAMVKLSATPGENLFKVPTEAIEQSVERGVAAQRTALDVAAQQNKAVCDAIKQQMPSAAAASAVESVERGVQTLIETHKSLLEIAAKPVKAAAASNA